MEWKSQVEIYDTTLRDGSQMEGVNFSLQDKLRIAEKLDEMGFHYIEGGWPGANPKDVAFFREVRKLSLKHAKICAFGSTRRADNPVEEDRNIRLLLESEAPVITIFGKSWTLHVTEALKTTLDENLRMIEESVSYLRKQGREVIYDAEHFFDGFKADPEYALKTLQVAWEAGARILVLCDTNGGTLPHEVEAIMQMVYERLGNNIPLGIHAHNDSGVAVANSIAAVRMGAVQVQGTVNGYGERCGNANLCTVIPNLWFKMRVLSIPEEKIRKLFELSHFVSEIANLRHDDHQPYVGRSAFAHKGGVHASAILRHPATYEHVPPEAVGNRRRIVVSDQAGKSNIVYRAREMGIDLDPKDPRLDALVQKIKEAENYGYQFEGADASFEILLRETLGEEVKFFELEGFRVIVEKRGNENTTTEATIKVRVDKNVVHTAAEGDGPVHALDNALRKALEELYPALRRIRLSDYKVRVLSEKEGTAAKIRVLIQSTDGEDVWGTVGVSTDIIEASWEALVNSVRYGLWRRLRKGK
ncbi:citramalate synthase [Candidatus Caldatribacterium sp.]|uniref:citramalate synthase n=1 Tax=Candidatus Caldatribacterium sp. TaxID=2282143 RepID=UPI0029917EDD|nr:citramalate synthase [Candidatus Caldatribacterium sp.]MDW8080655.1 citramalate synthase [Candidatus Calescibacterium sp.]